MTSASELEPVVRELFDALMLARPYVERAAQADPVSGYASSARHAVVVLEQVDGALADSQEVLP